MILSDSDLCGNPDVDKVNILGCSSHRATRLPKAHEGLLDTADGMDWETLVRLDRIWLVPKKEIKKHRGAVTRERRREMGRKMIKIFGLWVD